MFTFLAPYKWLIEFLAIGTILACVVFGAHRFLEHEQQIGYDKAVAEYTKKELIAEQMARLKEIEMNRQLNEARNEATLREQKITDLSHNLAATSSSLLNTINTLRNKLSSAPDETLRKQADTALNLLGECQKEYGQMAENADRHASDVKTLEDAWPK